MPSWVWLPLNIVQFVLIALWTAFWVLFAILVLLVTTSRRLALQVARYGWAPGFLAIAGARLEVEISPEARARIGKEPLIFIMNHQSMLDIGVAFKTIETELHFIAKKELKLVPFVGWYIWAMGMIFIDRRNQERAMQSLKRAAAMIRAGKSVIAYPEGTRSRTGELLPFKKGVFLTALEARVPMVPVVASGTGAIWPSNSVRFRPGKVRVRIGEPIDTSQFGFAERDRLIQVARERIVALQGALAAGR